MTEPSESFKLWHSERADSILKRAEELAADYIKDGFSDSGPTRLTALYKTVEDADDSGWSAWQAGREAALLDAMNATRAFGKTGAVISKVIGVLK
jgi:hypothetical protein